MDRWNRRTDTAVFGRFVYLLDPASGRGHDPEGLLGTPPALVTALLGLRVGCWLRAGKLRPLLIDRRGWPAWGRRFGINAIAAYAGSELMQILLPGLGQEWLYQHLFASWMTPSFGPYIPSLAFAVVFVAVWWLIAWAMDRRRIYLKL